VKFACRSPETARAKSLSLATPMPAVTYLENIQEARHHGAGLKSSYQLMILPNQSLTQVNVLMACLY
jgi:hypothetical protein